MTFTDARGVTVSLSYWRVADIQVHIKEKIMQFLFDGYRDEQARRDDLAPIGTKLYILTGRDYRDAWNDHQDGIKNLSQIAYATARATKDSTRPDPVDGTKTITESFFESAADVLEAAS
jgi:hypothetical protein